MGLWLDNAGPAMQIYVFKRFLSKRSRIHLIEGMENDNSFCSCVMDTLYDWENVLMFQIYFELY